MTETPVIGNARLNSFIMDGEVARLERAAALTFGAEACVAVARAQDGLAMALAVCGVGDGDTVLCSPLGHSSLTAAIRALGARPMFVDINPNTFNLDPYCLDFVLRRCVREKREEVPLPKALIATDLFGLPCNYGELSRLCGEYNIELVSDMGFGFGASYKDAALGSLGRFAAAAFFDNAGLGERGSEGVVFCGDGKDAEALRIMRGDGAVQEALGGVWPASPPVENAAQNIVLQKKLERFGRDAERRRKIAGWYRKRLEGVARVQAVPEGYQSACTQFALAFKSPEERRAVMRSLSAARIPCAIYCPMPLHMRGEVACWDRVVLVNAEQACQRLLILPMHPYLSEHVVDFICDCVAGALDNVKEEVAVVV
jgi:dTDP-4-amino-4,6-dideoxygalactose transaminase